MANRPSGYGSLRIDNCDERPLYYIGDISGSKDGTYTFNISIKSPDFSLFSD